MKKSGIRFGQRFKQTGQNDLDDLIIICQYLTRVGFVPKREHYMTFENGGLDMVGESIGMEYINTHPNIKIRHPDILFNTDGGYIVIEVDGKAHDHYVTNTNERNELYKKANIELIVLNKQELKLQGLSLIDGVRRGLTRIFAD